MEEERAYVEWLRGQEETKDTKPAIQLVSQKHRAVYIIPHCDHAFFVARRLGLEVKHCWQKTGWRMGWGQETTDVPTCTLYFPLFFFCLFYTSQRKNVRLQLWLKGAIMHLPTTGIQIKAKVIKKKHVLQWSCCHHLNFSSFLWLFFFFALLSF